MTTAYRAGRPARATRAGEVILSHNHIALLHGLYDRPGGHARSRSEWMRASVPFSDRMCPGRSAWSLRNSMITMPGQLVMQKRGSRSIAATLTDDGRAIIERRIPARITGRGRYLGLHSVDQAAVAASAARLADADIREAVAFSRAFGLPLLTRSTERSGGTIYALSRGLSQSFQLMSYEELHRRGPRSWHWDWARETIGQGNIPAAYLEHFADAEPDDLLEHLQEIRETDDEALTYIKVYHGAPILSRSRFERFLGMEIDLWSTDCPDDDLVDQIRLESPVYRKALNGIGGRLSWTHPDTGRVVGVAYSRKSPGCMAGIIVTNPAALSCLQRHWDACNVGLQIETRYVNPG